MLFISCYMFFVVYFWFLIGFLSETCYPRPKKGIDLVDTLGKVLVTSGYTDDAKNSPSRRLKASQIPSKLAS